MAYQKKTIAGSAWWQGVWMAKVAIFVVWDLKRFLAKYEKYGTLCIYVTDSHMKIKELNNTQPRSDQHLVFFQGRSRTIKRWEWSCSRRKKSLNPVCSWLQASRTKSRIKWNQVTINGRCPNQSTFFVHFVYYKAFYMCKVGTWLSHIWLRNPFKILMSKSSNFEWVPFFKFWGIAVVPATWNWIVFG